MKLQVFLTVFLTLLLTAVGVQAAQVTVTWDPNDPAPEGYRVFQRLPDDPYDYSAPAWEGPGVTASITYDDPVEPDLVPAEVTVLTFDRQQSTITLAWTQAEATSERTDYWIVRAYDGILESPDSDEVHLTVTRTRAVAKWDIFWSETAGGPYTKLDTAMAADGLGITKPFTAVASGESKLIYFTIVSYDENDAYSANATEISVQVNRSLPSAPGGISVTRVIPVE